MSEKRFNDIEKFTFKEFIQKYRDKRSDEIQYTIFTHYEQIIHFT